jgi:hypothetical protein
MYWNINEKTKQNRGYEFNCLVVQVQISKASAQQITSLLSTINVIPFSFFIDMTEAFESTAKHANSLGVDVLLTCRILNV